MPEVRRWYGIVTTHDGKELPSVLGGMAQLIPKPAAVVVTSDGLLDDVRPVVSAFAHKAMIRTLYVRTPWTGVARRSQTRNNGVRALGSRLGLTDMLFFLDGDVVIRPGHIKALARHSAADVILSYVWRLNDQRSDQLREAMCHGHGSFHPGLGERTQLMQYAAKIFIQLQLRRLGGVRRSRLVRPWWPSLGSGNFAVRFGAFEHVNGFDEEFVGWGREDADLGRRLYSAGFGAEAAVLSAAGFHLWHPSAPRTGENRGPLRQCQPVIARWGFRTPLDRVTSEMLVDEWREAGGGVA